MLFLWPSHRQQGSLLDQGPENYQDDRQSSPCDISLSTVILRSHENTYNDFIPRFRLYCFSCGRVFTTVHDASAWWHKRWSRSSVMTLNTCLVFNVDHLGSFLDLDHVRTLAVYGRVRELSDIIKNILICVLEMNGGRSCGSGTTWGWAINDRSLIFELTNLLILGMSAWAPVCMTLDLSALMRNLTFSAALYKLDVISCKWYPFSASRAISSAKSRSDPSQSIPAFGIAIAFLITKSRATMNRNDDKMHPCLTPVSMAKMSAWPVSVLTQQLELLYKDWKTAMNFFGTPHSCKIFHKDSRWTLSKAFLKSIKLMESGCLYSR